MYKLSYAFKFQPEEHDPDQLGFWFATEKLERALPCGQLYSE